MQLLVYADYRKLQIHDNLEALQDLAIQRSGSHEIPLTFIVDSSSKLKNIPNLESGDQESIIVLIDVYTLFTDTVRYLFTVGYQPLNLDSSVGLMIMW